MLLMFSDDLYDTETFHDQFYCLEIGHGEVAFEVWSFIDLGT